MEALPGDSYPMCQAGLLAAQVRDGTPRPPVKPGVHLPLPDGAGFAISPGKDISGIAPSAARVKLPVVQAAAARYYA